jgi:hypothetical protein
MVKEGVEPGGGKGEAMDHASGSALPAPKGNRNRGPLLPAGEKGRLLRRWRTGGGEEVQEYREGNPHQGESAEEAKPERLRPAGGGRAGRRRGWGAYGITFRCRATSSS